jgi:phosphoglycerate dehydrogenase-like enzyme
VRALLPGPEYVPDPGDVPDGVVIDTWPSERLAEIEFYVPDYVFAVEPYAAMAQMPALMVVQLLTAGIEHAEPYVPPGVTLCNARGVHDTSTAELAVALTLAAITGLGDYARAQLTGEWRHGFRDALADRTVLIVGYGAIGAAVERRLVGFEVTVVRVARSARPGVSPFTELPALLPQADVVILTLPLTSETRGMVGKDFLAALPDRSVLVNVARGPIVDTEALVAEVRAGRLRAALDVTDPEPLPAAHPLWRAPGVLISPHVGGASSAFLPRARRLIRDQLRRYAAGEPLANVISLAG